MGVLIGSSRTHEHWWLGRRITSSWCFIVIFLLRLERESSSSLSKDRLLQVGSSSTAVVLALLWLPCRRAFESSSHPTTLLEGGGAVVAAFYGEATIPWPTRPVHYSLRWMPSVDHRSGITVFVAVIVNIVWSTVHGWIRGLLPVLRGVLWREGSSSIQRLIVPWRLHVFLFVLSLTTRRETNRLNPHQQQCSSKRLQRHMSFCRMFIEVSVAIRTGHVVWMTTIGKNATRKWAIWPDGTSLGRNAGNGPPSFNARVTVRASRIDRINWLCFSLQFALDFGYKFTSIDVVLFSPLTASSWGRIWPV